MYTKWQLILCLEHSKGGAHSFRLRYFWNGYVGILQISWESRACPWLTGSCWSLFLLDSDPHFCTRASIRFVSEVTLISLFQIPASLTCSKLCGVQGGAGQDHLEGIRVISFLRGQGNTARYTLALAASTIIVDTTNRLQMEVTRGVEARRSCRTGTEWYRTRTACPLLAPGDIGRGWVGRQAGQLHGLPAQHRGGGAGACAGVPGLDRGILVLVLVLVHPPGGGGARAWQVLPGGGGARARQVHLEELGRVCRSYVGVLFILELTLVALAKERLLLSRY